MKINWLLFFIAFWFFLLLSLSGMAQETILHFRQSGLSSKGGMPYWDNAEAGSYVSAGENDRNARLVTVIVVYQKIPISRLAIKPDTSYEVFPEKFEAVRESMEPFLD